MSKKHHIVAISALLAAGLLSGCGSSNKEGGIIPVSGSASLARSQSCIGCHATNKISPVTGDQIVSEWLRSAHNLKNGAACSDCHAVNDHPTSGTTPTIPATGDICKTCHTQNLLNKPHFAAPTDDPRAAQYVAADGQCISCHNPHDMTSAMPWNRDWADSGHGSTKYVAADATAGSVNSHYQWATSFGGCAIKCHTTSGFLGGAPSALHNETIMCSACHADYNWTNRRVIGAQTTIYQYNAADIILPNAGDSNLCIACHAGRGNTQSAIATRNGSVYHHAVAAGVLYASQTHTGYEFAGQDYTNGVQTHNTISNTLGGPCVACHMKSSGSHKFSAVTRNAAGTITTINSSATCSATACHASTMTAAHLNDSAAGYQDAGKLLSDLLVTNGIVITDANAAATIPTLSAFNYGAWQNSFLTSDDPGAYAHNSRYAKRLLFDSIDWLQHGSLTGTIDTTGYPKAAIWYNANVISKLANRP